jgi:hypothetical protein
MGMAIYASYPLTLRFPPIVFKLLLSEPLEAEDIACFDEQQAQTISQMRSYHQSWLLEQRHSVPATDAAAAADAAGDDGGAVRGAAAADAATARARASLPQQLPREGSLDDLAAKLEAVISDPSLSFASPAELSLGLFAVYDASGAFVPLVPNGLEVEVYRWNAGLYCELSEEFLLSQFTEQVRAMQRGLLDVIPAHSLFMLNCAQLKRKTLAEETFDVDFLRQNTRMTGEKVPNWYIEAFWNVLKSYDLTDRRRFLRFVWGRETLPTRTTGFSEKFRINLTSNTRHLPSSSTCAFRMDLPVYKTADILREKLTLAIRNTVMIDADSRVDLDSQLQAFTQARMT